MFYKRDINFQFPNSIMNWVKSREKNKWQLHNGGAFYSELTKIDEEYFSFNEARRKILAELNIKNASICDGVKNYLVYVPVNKCLAAHTDAVYVDYSHKRFLYTINECDEGGLYIDDSGELRFANQECYEIDADTEHKITTVHGTKPLILLVLSYIKQKDNICATQ